VVAHYPFIEKQRKWAGQKSRVIDRG